MTKTWRAPFGRANGGHRSLHCVSGKGILIRVNSGLRPNQMRTSLRSILAAISFLSTASPVMAGDTYPRQTGFRVANYSFTVSLSDASDELVITDRVDLV